MHSSGSTGGQEQEAALPWIAQDVQ